MVDEQRLDEIKDEVKNNYTKKAAENIITQLERIVYPEKRNPKFRVCRNIVTNSLDIDIETEILCKFKLEPKDIIYNNEEPTILLADVPDLEVYLLQHYTTVFVEYEVIQYDSAGRLEDIVIEYLKKACKFQVDNEDEYTINHWKENKLNANFEAYI